MRLIVYELLTSRTQELTTDGIKQVYAVRPHLYRKASPAGTIKVQIKTMADVLVAESDAVSIASLGSGTYWHGYRRFVVSASLAANTEYKFVVVTSGYTFGESAYVAWVSGLDLGNYATGYVVTDDFHSPLDLEVWTRKQVTKGVV